MSKHTSIGKLFVAKRKRRKLRADMDKISPDSILSDELVSRRLDPYSNLFSHPPDVEDLTTRFLPAYGIYFTAEEALKSKLPIQKLAVVVSAREQRDRLLSYWASASIVLALLSSMSVSCLFFFVLFVRLYADWSRLQPTSSRQILPNYMKNIMTIFKLLLFSMVQHS